MNLPVSIFIVQLTGMRCVPFVFTFQLFFIPPCHCAVLFILLIHRINLWFELVFHRTIYKIGNTSGQTDSVQRTIYNLSQCIWSEGRHEWYFTRNDVHQYLLWICQISLRFHTVRIYFQYLISYSGDSDLWFSPHPSPSRFDLYHGYSGSRLSSESANITKCSTSKRVHISLVLCRTFFSARSFGDFVLWPLLIKRQ